MQKLLSIQNEDTKSLTDYVTHTNSATNNLIALAPSTLTIQNIIDVIGIHAAIAGLDQAEYGPFTLSLLLIGTLNHTTVSTAFRNKDMKHQANLVSGTALSVTKGKKTTITMCAVCKKRGHTSDRFWVTHPELKPT